MDLQTPVDQAGRIYKTYAQRLEKLHIYTLADFLYHAPFRYEDYSLISKISQVQPGEKVTIRATVVDIKNQYTRAHKTLQIAQILDDTGNMEVTWFNQPYLTRYIKKGDTVSLSGKIDLFNNKLILQSPEYEIIHPENPDLFTLHTGRLVPVYPETRGVSSKWLRRQIYKIIQDNRKNIFDYIPESIRQRHGLPSLIDAIEHLHFPADLQQAAAARQRLAFDELLLMQLTALYKKNQWKEHLKAHSFSITQFQKQIEKFLEKLPFTLTNAQQNAIRDIFQDLSSEKPMNRLLEGDVGSGKTVVATVAMYVAYLNGFQSVLMAPTEILAQQHYNTINNLLSPLGVTVGLATGGKKFKIQNSKFKILVGTHAVLSEKIQFEKLGLVIVDEQQRFGVNQRSIIRNKGKNPHFLTMTATPIPRTVALTMYGDLDLSQLLEMPKGRRRVKTWLVPIEKRTNAYDWIKKQIKETGVQAFIVCPFIEESENMQTVKAAAKEYEHLQKEVFTNISLGLLHGKLKAKEKNQVLDAFRERKTEILVATPVVEVGIDIPNATIILIEGAERFGLAQLHQLRGRVGRGDMQSYCLLFTESNNPLTTARLKSMETIHNGTELAELDLRLRGPGDIYGTAQHGVYNLKIASFSDFALIEKTKKEAAHVFPKLKDYPLLSKKLKVITLKSVSPD